MLDPLGGVRCPVSGAQPPRTRFEAHERGPEERQYDTQQAPQKQGRRE